MEWLAFILIAGAAFLPVLAAKTVRSRAVWLAAAVVSAVPLLLLALPSLRSGDWIAQIAVAPLLLPFWTACLVLGVTGVAMLLSQLYERRHGAPPRRMWRIGMVAGVLLVLLGLCIGPGLARDYQACRVKRAVIDDVFSAQGEGASLEVLRKEITDSASLAAETGRTETLANLLVDGWHPSLKRGYMLDAAVPSELTSDELELDIRAREKLLKQFNAFGEGLYYASSETGGGSIGDGLHADGERASALADLPDDAASRVEFDYPSCALVPSGSTPRSILKDAEIRRFDLVFGADDSAVPVARFWVASEDGSDWFVVGLERLF